LSPEARAKIAAAQKARWAKTKKAAKKEAHDSVAVPTTKTANPKRAVKKKKKPVKKAAATKGSVGTLAP
jgi:hypothetical protein